VSRKVSEKESQEEVGKRGHRTPPSNVGRAKVAQRPTKKQEGERRGMHDGEFLFGGLQARRQEEGVIRESTKAVNGKPDLGMPDRVNRMGREGGRKY